METWTEIKTGEQFGLAVDSEMVFKRFDMARSIT